MAVLALGAMTGCAQLQLGEPIPSIENIRKLHGFPASPVSLGVFRLAPGRSESIDRSVSVRTNVVYSPYQNSFAQYLRHTLAADLAAAGLLDPSSPIVVSADLVDSSLDVPMHVAPGVPTGMGQARVAARFVVTRSGRSVFDREFVAQDSWNPEFLGVTAITHGINRYTMLHRNLVGQLLDDPAFRQALGPSP